MTEDELTDSVIDLAHTFGWMAFHPKRATYQTKAGTKWLTPFKGDKGFPDLVLARTGQVIFAELKVGKNKPDDDQQKWGDVISDGPFTSLATTHTYHVWTDKDWEDDTITKALR